MKLTIDRGALLKALAHAQGVVEKRNTIPILANVLLKAEKGALHLSATDMELEIVETVRADVAQPGATTAPAAMLYDIVRKLPEGSDVELDCPAGKDQLTIKAGRSHFKLGCLPVDDFPQMAGGELPHSIKLSVDSLIHLIDRTKFAMSTEETRYYLNGIYLHAATSHGTKVLRAVATDGHRLARMEVPLPEGGEGMPGIILPRKAVGEIRKLLEEGADNITLAPAPRFFHRGRFPVALGRTGRLPLEKRKTCSPCPAPAMPCARSARRIKLIWSGRLMMPIWFMAWETIFLIPTRRTMPRSFSSATLGGQTAHSFA